MGLFPSRNVFLYKYSHATISVNRDKSVGIIVRNRQVRSNGANAFSIANRIKYRLRFVKE